MGNKIICETCGSTDVTVKNNICICNVCGNKFAHKVLNNDVDKLSFYIHEAETFIGNNKFLDAEKSAINALSINPKAAIAWGIRAICVREKIKDRLANYRLWVDDYIDYISKSLEFDDGNSEEHEKTKSLFLSEFDTSMGIFISRTQFILEKLDYYIDYANSGIPVTDENANLIELSNAGLNPIFEIVTDIHEEKNGEKPIEKKFGFAVCNFEKEVYEKISKIIINVYSNQIFNGYLNKDNNKSNWGKFINNSNIIKKMLFMLNDLLKDDTNTLNERLKTIILIDRNILKSTYFDGSFKCNDISDEKTNELEEEIVKIEGMLKQ